MSASHWQPLEHILCRAADKDTPEPTAREPPSPGFGPQFAHRTRQNCRRPAHLQVHIIRCDPVLGDEVMQLRALLLLLAHQVFRRDSDIANGGLPAAAAATIAVGK